MSTPSVSESTVWLSHAECYYILSGHLSNNLPASSEHVKERPAKLARMGLAMAAENIARYGLLKRGCASCLSELQ